MYKTYNTFVLILRQQIICEIVHLLHCQSIIHANLKIVKKRDFFKWLYVCQTDEFIFFLNDCQIYVIDIQQ